MEGSLDTIGLVAQPPGAVVIAAGRQLSQGQQPLRVSARAARCSSPTHGRTNITMTNTAYAVNPTSRHRPLSEFRRPVCPAARICPTAMSG